MTAWLLAHQAASMFGVPESYLVELALTSRLPAKLQDGEIYVSAVGAEAAAKKFHALAEANPTGFPRR